MEESTQSRQRVHRLAIDSRSVNEEEEKERTFAVYEAVDVFPNDMRPVKGSWHGPCRGQRRGRIIGKIRKLEYTASLDKEGPPYTVTVSNDFLSLNRLVRPKAKKVLFPCAVSHLCERPMTGLMLDNIELLPQVCSTILSDFNVFL